MRGMYVHYSIGVCLIKLSYCLLLTLTPYIIKMHNTGCHYHYDVKI